MGKISELMDKWELVCDSLNQLVEAKKGRKSLHFSYNPLGRRLNTTFNEGYSQGKEEYLYDGQEEIGSFTPNLEVQNLKILGKSTQESFPSTIAIEIDGKPFAPIVDLQGNVRHLLDLRTKKIVNRYAYSAFGEPPETYEKVFNPWRYAAKRIDPELGFLYFGKRYYDPVFGRWLTIDPAGFVDSMNLYQYCLNNPFAYLDPNGEFLFLLIIPLSYITTTMILEAAAVAVAGAIAAWATYEACNYLEHATDKTLPRTWHRPPLREYDEDEEDYNPRKNNRPKDDDPPNPLPPNGKQNKQADDAKAELQRRLDRKLTRKEEREFHDLVTKQGYDYHEMVDEGYWLYQGRLQHGH